MQDEARVVVKNTFLLKTHSVGEKNIAPLFMPFWLSLRCPPHPISMLSFGEGRFSIFDDYPILAVATLSWGRGDQLSSSFMGVGGAIFFSSTVAQVEQSWCAAVATLRDGAHANVFSV